MTGHLYSVGAEEGPRQGPQGSQHTSEGLEVLQEVQEVRRS